jgi:WD40 repeat protein
MESSNLNILAVIGFNGNTIDGLILHPDNEHIIYALGCQLVIRNVLTRTQRFLRGHTTDISTISISSSGRYIATGQRTYSGFKADIIIWDFETGSLVHRLTIHKSLIQSLCFSYNEKYLVSLGGAEDNYLIVWDVETGKAISGTTAGTDFVHQVKFFNTADDQLITCQNFGIKIWKVDFQQKKVNIFLTLVTKYRCKFWKLKTTNHLLLY